MTGTTFLEDRYDALMAGEWTIPLRYSDLRARGEQSMSAEAYDYVDESAGRGDTRAENRRALDRIRIRPQALRDVSDLDLGTTLLDWQLPAPVLLAPIGGQAMYHEEAELASARAAAGLDLPFVLSTAATRSIEAVAEAMGDGPRIFQLYWPPDRELTDSYLERAEAAGYDAVMVTVDSQLPRWRPRNLENGYRPGDGGPHAIPCSDPVVEQRAAAAGTSVDAFVEDIGLEKNRALTWEDIEGLQDRTALPVIVKGILRVSDAREAMEHADGLVVSNHGGRQIDGGIGSASVLPEIVDAVGDDGLVLFDSGIRAGADTFRALALGADAVMVGRPFIYGLAIAGEQGVREVLLNHLAELESALGLAGYDAITAVGREAVVEQSRR